MAIVSLFMAKLVGKTTDQFRINLFHIIPMYFGVETNVLFVFQFTFWIWALKLRNHKINVHLRDNFSHVNGNRSSENLNRIAILHDKLVDVSELINRCYGMLVSVSTRHSFNMFSKSNLNAAHDSDSNGFRLRYSLHLQLC